MSFNNNNYESTTKSNNNTFDNDIKNYTIQDIYDLLNITSARPTDTQINTAIDIISSKMKKEGNYDIVHFLSAARIKVIQEMRDNQFNKTFTINAKKDNGGNGQEDGEEDDEDDEEEQDGEQDNEEQEEDGEEDGDQDDEQNDEDTQNNEDGNMNNNINEAYGIDEEDDDIKEIADNELYSDPENGKFIQKNNVPTDIKHTYEVPFVKGTVNPLLATTVKRSIIVDSYYRQSPLDTNNTSFLFNLSHELKYIIGMQLYSIQIPTTWNNIDPLLGNSSFQINKNGLITMYNIPAGYYTTTSLNAVLNSFDAQIVFSLNTLSCIQVINNSGNIASLIFYQGTLGAAVNKNLGWTLGFRSPVITMPDANPIIGFQPDLYGSKYFTLAIDDFNNNHLNDFVVNSSSANLQNDAFAIIPLKDINPPIPYVDYDSNLEIFKRTYFGPVNISKLKITLYNDRGNIVNLNQQDWSFTLIVEQMYKN